MADAVVESYRTYALNFRTDQLLVPWGCDFEHIDATASFSLMDEVMAAIKANSSYSGMNLFYSHPDKYTRAVMNEGYTWPENKDDYLLGSDDGHSYWSGYFSSRAAFKRWERVLMGQMTSADKMLSSLPYDDGSTYGERWGAVDKLRQAMGVAQHHDAITGTARQSVDNQYRKILHEGSVASAEAEGALLEAFTGLEHPSPCPLANLSVCIHTAPLKEGKDVTVIVYNSVGWDREEVVTIPVPISTVGAFMDGVALVTQVHDTWQMTTSPDPTTPQATGKAHAFEAVFVATIKATYARLMLRPNGGALRPPNECKRALHDVQHILRRRDEPSQGD